VHGEREFPRDVLGVVQTGVEALTAERARQVPGIAEEEPAAAASRPRRRSTARTRT
jgi:hypothetical protein